MSSIFVNRASSKLSVPTVANGLFSAGQTHADTFQPFDVAGISINEGTTRTGMREDVVLLSWLIVLLRTSEGGQAGYDWTYKHKEDGYEAEAMTGHLSTSEVMPGFQSTVGQVTAAISNHIKATAPGQSTFKLGPESLLLSSSSLSRACVDIEDKVIEQIRLCLQVANK